MNKNTGKAINAQIIPSFSDKTEILIKPKIAKKWHSNKCYFS